MLLSAKRRAHFCKRVATEMGGVSLCFSKVSGSGVHVTLLKGARTEKKDATFLLTVGRFLLTANFFSYSCVWELFCLQFELFTYNWSFLAYR